MSQDGERLGGREKRIEEKSKEKTEETMSNRDGKRADETKKTCL